MLTPKDVDQAVKIAAVTRSAVRRRHSPEVLQEKFFRQIRIERIKQAQEEERWIANLKGILIGDITKLSIEEAKLWARIASEYEVNECGILFFCPRSTEDSDSRVELVRLVISELLQQDFLHHYQTSLEGGHQGIGRTYQRIPTGEDSIGVSSFTWENVLIERQDKKTYSLRRIYGECPSHLPVSNNRDGSHTVTTAIFQRKHLFTFVGVYVLRVRDRQGDFLHHCTNDR